MNPCKKTIEWADFTANPFTGCLHGCDYCYARRMAKRLSGVDGTAYNFAKKSFQNPFSPVFNLRAWHKFRETMLKRKKPTRIFLGSMSDLGGSWNFASFNSSIPTPLSRIDIQRAVYLLACETPQHTYLILTKNPAGLAGDWPDNCHIGVSADNNKDAARNVRKLLLNVKARVRWVSLEPLLEPVNPGYLKELDWIVIGGQTGPGAPPVPIENVEEIVSKHMLKIPIFIKKNIRKQTDEYWPVEFPG